MVSTSEKSPATALLSVNLAAVIFGSTALFGRLPVSPVWIVAGRGAFAAGALFVIGRLRRPVGDRAPWRGALVCGALLAVHWTAFFAAVQWGGVAVATLTFATFPVFTIVFEAARGRRRPRVVELLATFAIVAAVALITGPGLPHTTHENWARAHWGAVVGMVSAIAFAAFGLVSQAMAARCDSVDLSMRQNLFVALLLSPALPFAQPGPASLGDWAWIAVLGVVATALAHQLYIFALRRLPAAACGAFVSLEPVYAIVLAAMLFAEPIGPIVVISAALIVGASLVLLRQTRAA